MALKKHMMVGVTVGFFSAFMPYVSHAANLALTPPSDIDFSLCQKPNAPLDDLAAQVKNASLSQFTITDNELLGLAILYQNGSGKTIPDINQTVRILEFLLSKNSTEQKIKDRAFILKAELLKLGEGYTQDKEAAKTVLRGVIDGGNEAAYVHLAKILELDGMNEAAAEMYKKASANKDPVAALSLAYLYHNKDIIVSDDVIDRYVIAAQNTLLEKLALGQCEYFGKVGSMYLNLRGLANREELAAQWLLLAANFDHARNKLQLADLINKGYLSDIADKPTANQLWLDAAKLGNDDAMLRYGLFLISQDKSDEAIEWIKQSGERNNIKAIEYLIDYYQPSLEQKMANDNYLFWLEKASLLDEVEPEILLNYANALRQNRNGNVQKIYDLYERAGRRGNDEALFMMGEAHRLGIGVERNPTKALRYYRLATQKSNLDAYEAIINAYQCGIGKDVNDEIANKWATRGLYYGLKVIYGNLEADYQNASDAKQRHAVLDDYIPRITLIARDKKSVRAMMTLHALYSAKGNSEKANFWRDRALDMDKKNGASGDGHYQYAQILTGGIFMPADNNLSNDYMQKAANLNNASAIKYFGRQAENAGDYKKASDYFERAYQLGDESSLIKLADMDLKLNNIESAFSRLETSANDGSPDAMFKLAAIQQTSNPENARAWFNKAVETPICDTGDILMIAESYASGDNGAPKDNSKAEAWLGRLKSIDSMKDGDKIDFAKMILNSDSFKDTDNYQKALVVLDSVANAKSLQILADYYLGNPALNAPEKTVAYVTQSAEVGNTKSMVDLARLYMSGHMVDKSIETASRWLEKANENGNAEAQALLKSMTQD